MAAFGEKIAASLVSDILKKLSSYPEKKIIGIWKVEKEFQKLKRTFGMLVAALTVAEKQQDNNELVEDWLERLKDVAYEADDVLGEFSFEAARMGIDMRIDSSKMEKVRSFLSNKDAVKFRSNMADKIEKIYKKLDDIGKDMEMFKYILGGVNIDHSQNGQGPMITSSVIEDLHFLGRENEKSKLMDILIGCSSSNEETLSVVSIVGIGGLGKTTLARMVYNHNSVIAHFGNNRMWVWVPRDFEIRKLREGMVQSLTGKKLQSSKTDEFIQKKLDEKLRGKKFLLVLDNVWNVDIGGWEKLRASLKTGAEGSKIIVTTRFTSVASIIRTHLEGPEPLHLEGLSEEESWSLFQKRAFAVGGARKNSNTEKIGKELVEKCKGVPLAIKSLGAFMHSKTTDLEWASIQFSEIWKLEGQDNISSVLKLSYHDMPPPVKLCFTYCSIFPKGHKIVKKTLIQMWMAEGLLQSSSEDKLMEDVGLEYFKSLLWISFLQDVERDQFGEEVACKMHDLVHDLAQSIIGKECRILEDFDNKDIPKVDEETRYLSVVGDYKETTPEKFDKVEKVRAYLYLGGSNYLADPIHISAKMFSNFRNLRVLVLTDAGIESLPSSIDMLKQLRYLDVSKNNFATFPESVTGLYNLQTLKMLDVSFDSILPKGITKMINLRHLEIEHGLRFPKGIGQLMNLQTLSYFTDAKDVGIEELGYLRQLGGSLELNLYSQIIKSASAANLKEKPRLRKLQLTFLQSLDSRDDERDRQPPLEKDFDSDNRFLESLQPHPNLISLEIFRFRGSVPPTWLDGSGTSHPSLSFLQYLKLVHCSNIKSLSLAGLCSLRQLVIEACPNLCLGLGKGLTALEDIIVGEDEYIDENYIPKIIPCNSLMSLGVAPEGDGMPDLISLKTLKIDRCHSLATLPDGFFSFLTSLNTLRVRQCQILTTLPESMGNLSSLQNLTIEGCRRLAALPQSCGSLSALQNLTIKYCHRLAALPESLGSLSALQNLTIKDCESLAALPESFGSLSALQNLTLDQWCGSLAALVESLRNLSALQNFSFGNLSALPSFTIQCGSLAELVAEVESAALQLFIPKLDNHLLGFE